MENNQTDFQALTKRIEDIDDALDRMQDEMRQGYDSLEHRIHEPPEPDLKDLFKALAAAQGEIQDAEHDAEGQAGNRVYPYATLSSVLKAIRGPLSKNGLSLIQLPRPCDSATNLGLMTILAHESGQRVENYWEIPVPKPDPQGFGSALTYMRRYAAMAIIGISGAADDDAGGAMGDPDEYERISADEVDAILNKADELFGDKADEVLERMCDKLYDVKKVVDIRAGEAELAMRRLENQAKREKQLAQERNKKPPKDPDPKDSK